MTLIVVLFINQLTKNYIQPNSLDMLFPIIFFIDITQNDTNGRCCLEKVRFTLSFLEDILEINHIHGKHLVIWLIKQI